VAPVQRQPAPFLRPWVHRYYGFEETTRSPIRRCEGPGIEIILLLSFGPEWRIGDAIKPSAPWDLHTSFVGGLRKSSVLTEHGGHSYGVQVSLTPTGGHALLGVPMNELAGRTVDLDAILTRDASLLPERLAGLRTWTERFDFLDSNLSARLQDAQPPSGAVVWAWRRLTATHGLVPVGELTRELGWSRKRLGARFREEIGISPKSFAGLLRFERTKKLLKRCDHQGLAQVALQCGYYDQSHLSHEVHRITGLTPNAYRALLRGETNLQDAAAKAI
jgi:AraC-like DNA-binding protein